MNDKTEVTWHPHTVSRRRGGVVWLTGLSGSGKSTIANLVDAKLHAADVASFVLDGDNVRHGLNASPELLAPTYGEAFAKRFGLGFSAQDREENIRRIGAVAELFAAAGVIVLAAFVSPYRRDRDAVRRCVEKAGSPGDFVEVYINTPLDVCETRDPKGLYAKARAGKLRGFTGIDAPYEPPSNAEIILDASQQSPEESAETVATYLRGAGKI